MNKTSKRKDPALVADLLMVILCGITSFWLLASPLVPYPFTLDSSSGMPTFLIADLLLSAALSVVGVTLNHLAARNARVTLRRRR